MNEAAAVECVDFVLLSAPALTLEPVRSSLLEALLDLKTLLTASSPSPAKFVARRAKLSSWVRLAIVYYTSGGIHG